MCNITRTHKLKSRALVPVTCLTVDCRLFNAHRLFCFGTVSILLQPPASLRTRIRTSGSASLARFISIRFSVIADESYIHL